MSNFKIVDGMIIETFYCNEKGMRERTVRVKLLEGTVEELSLDALGRGVRTEQCCKYGHSHEVVSTEKPCGICIPSSDIKGVLGEAGIAFEYSPWEYEIKYLGGSMKDGYGGSATTTHHAFGSLRALPQEAEEGGWDCGAGGHRFMGPQDEYCSCCGDWVGPVEG